MVAFVRANAKKRVPFVGIFPSPGGSALTSLSLPVNSAPGFPSFARDAQSLHRTYDRDRTPRIAAASRQNVVVASV
jgi:hypothetical protein